MRIVIKSPVPFIRKDNVTEGDVIEKGGGTYEFYTADGFRQILKQSEYERLIAASDKAGKVASKQEKEEVLEDDDSEQTSSDDKKEARRAALEKKSKKQLLKLAGDLYENVDAKTPEKELIDLIIDAEFPAS